MKNLFLSYAVTLRVKYYFVNIVNIHVTTDIRMNVTKLRAKSIKGEATIRNLHRMSQKRIV